ncbi:hypothetical protein, variant [Verruconis gallopava]|nr:hypothetical protein, variant [Verruconis gallopava]KIW06288.1 hypothetical protein, variant [Verruconis gallopava]
MHPRPHSHSLSVPSINAAHRVTRRKSMSSTAANREAAVSALLKENPAAGGDAASRRGPKASKGTFPASLPDGSAFGQAGYDAKYGNAITDTNFLEVLPEDVKGGSSKARARRASEGSHLRKEGKRVAGGELRCDTCGKGYKHSSCLNKHLWEHTPEWQITSKLLISKHQQVQLLEAASVLVSMNSEAPSGSAIDSDASSPAASGSSDPQDSEMSSIETTPPPQLDDAGFSSAARTEFNSKRYSTNSSAYSQSYQSSVFSESAPSGRPYMSHHRQYSTDGRPTTSGTSVNGGDDFEHADLTAAVGLLSCSYGTPKSGPVMLPPDAPPVPPLPSRFLGSKADHLSPSTLTYNASQNYSYLREKRDVDMDAEMSDEEPDRHRGRSDDDDEGMFGKMEE